MHLRPTSRESTKETGKERRVISRSWYFPDATTNHARIVSSSAELEIWCTYGQPVAESEAGAGEILGSLVFEERAAETLPAREMGTGGSIFDVDRATDPSSITRMMGHLPVLTGNVTHLPSPIPPLACNAHRSTPTLRLNQGGGSFGVWKMGHLPIFTGNESHPLPIRTAVYSTSRSPPQST